MANDGERPKLKLNVSSRAIAESQPAELSSTPIPPSAGFRLKFKKPTPSQTFPPATDQSTPLSTAGTSARKTAKKGKGTPTASPATTGKKRVRNGADDDTGSPALKKQQSRRPSVADSVTIYPSNTGSSRPNGSRPSLPKIKLIRKPQPKSAAGVKLKVLRKGKVPERPAGVGYDSEASDVEEDPAIEEQFILRMAPGPDCDYLREAIANKQLGEPVRAGGADVRLKFFNKDGRKAVLTIRGKHYAAVLVDLPCIIESMKSWDKKNWLKSADVSQMLLVLDTVQSEEEAKNYAVPPIRDIDRTGGGWQYAHGITPPMKWVRKRRFRKRVSHRTIEAVEEEVERLLAADEEALKNKGEASRYEVLNLDRMASEQAETEEEAGSYEEDQDAEGEVDYGGFAEGEVAREVANEEDIDAAMLAEIEQGLLAGDEDDPNSTTTVPAVDHAVAAGDVQAGFADGLPLGVQDIATPDVTTNTPSANQEDSGDDEEEDDAIEEVDEDLLEQQQERQQQREEIMDLENAIRAKKAEMARVQSTVLKTRLSKDIKGLESDLQIKRAAAGLDGDDE